ncbi:hypothetical protein GA0061099_10164 [Bradyrhizobium yuanmingense]|uniref:Uncharacterized protein n=1 Tax=Bradyrhizobium yuanmingense TaxID=108015 RepID=A0A1C3XG18_9BRAD|nr:hypothetical protein IQ15_07069 [Bradyrhizobium yuanmingense]SCB51213.1 hypothetical protein GA0061099_10164 [Bradyrhizobium yuanmingense]
MALPVRDEHNGVGTLTPRPSRQLNWVSSVNPHVSRPSRSACTNNLTACADNASLARRLVCRAAADALDWIAVLSWLWCSAAKSKKANGLYIGDPCPAITSRACLARLSAKVSSACSATARLGAIEILLGLLATPNQFGMSLSKLTAFCCGRSYSPCDWSFRPEIIEGERFGASPPAGRERLLDRPST